MKYSLNKVCNNLFSKFDIDFKRNSRSLITKKINQDIRLCYIIKKFYFKQKSIT